MPNWKSLIGAGKGVVVFTRKGCQYCAKAKSLLGDLKVNYSNQDVTTWEEADKNLLKTESNHSTFPNIWLNTNHIGGYDKLNELYITKKLFDMLKEANISYQDPKP